MKTIKELIFNDILSVVGSGQCNCSHHRVIITDPMARSEMEKFNSYDNVFCGSTNLNNAEECSIWCCKTKKASSWLFEYDIGGGSCGNC